MRNKAVYLALGVAADGTREVLGTQQILLYTLALDLPGTLDWRLMAKTLAGSILRNYFAGTVRVVRNTEEPVFRLLGEGAGERAPGKLRASAPVRLTAESSRLRSPVPRPCLWRIRVNNDRPRRS